MKENMLLKLALIFSLVGLIVLFVLSNAVEPGEYNAGLNSFQAGEYVKAKGVVSKISSGNNAVFIELRQYTPVNIVVFEDDNISINDGDEIEVIGKTEEYNGEFEIIASRIRKIS